AVELFAGLAFAIGPLLGGLMYTAGGFKLPFLVMAVLLCLSIPAVLLFLPNTEVFCFFRGKYCFWGIFMVAIFGLQVFLTLGLSLFSFLDPTLAPFTKKMGLNAAYTGLLFMVLSLAYALSTAVVGRILPAKIVLNCTRATLGQFVICVYLPCIAFCLFLFRKIWLLCISLGLNGVGGSLILIPSVPEMQRCCLNAGFTNGLALNSMLSGIFTAGTNFGGFAGPVLGGILVDKLGFPWMATVR
ncbi:predicted protein, partial [Nematostella vectensis]